MKMRRSRTARTLAAAFCLLLAGAGCVLPNKGTPIFVDSREGRFWDGKGMLLEVSPDEKRCRVRVRDRSFIVREMWVECLHIHPR